MASEHICVFDVIPTHDDESREGKCAGAYCTQSKKRPCAVPALLRCERLSYHEVIWHDRKWGIFKVHGRL